MTRPSASTAARAALHAVPVPGWIVLTSTLLLAGVVAVDAPAALRVPLALAWGLVVPGLAWMDAVRGLDGADALLVAVALSAALLLLAGGVLALLSVHSGVAAFVVLAVTAVAGVVRSARHRAAAGAGAGGAR
jgi:lysylphosphatidylglycerol synthetase-like protein (DUF2156 family)